MATQQQSAFPSELPSRPGGGHGQSFKDRNCPNMRSCWSFSFHAYSLRTGGDKAMLARRICMLLTLSVRTVISIISIIMYFVDRRYASGAINCILAVLGFLFIAWALAQIGEAKGYRTVLGIRVGRWHFDIFLVFCALAHSGLLVGLLFGLGPWGSTGVWIAMWLLIFGAAWIATWQPDEPPSQV